MYFSERQRGRARIQMEALSHQAASPAGANSSLRPGPPVQQGSSPGGSARQIHSSGNSRAHQEPEGRQEPELHPKSSLQRGGGQKWWLR